MLTDPDATATIIVSHRNLVFEFAPAWVLLLTAMLFACVPARPPLAIIGDEIQLGEGRIKGMALADGAVHVYRGIPYAAAPVGDLRWAPPRPQPAWQGTLDATAYGPACVQPKLDIELYASADLRQSEDCLTLNVWTAAADPAERRPVMVWIHGGALIYGNGRVDGAALARKGAVVVGVNYRLGPFGFLAHPELSAASARGVSGNQGFLDQIRALEWVRDNIEAFGGDPQRVTIFGESAGSLSVSALMASERAKGLFHRAIGQSGSIFANRFRLRAAPREGAGGGFASAEDLGVALGAALGAPPFNAIAHMRGRSSADVLAAWDGNPDFTDYFSMPVIDGWVISATAAEVFAQGRHSDVPVMLGSNADEGTAIAAAVAPSALESKAGYERWMRSRLGGLADRALELYPAATDADVVGALNDVVCDEMFTWAMRAWSRGMANGKSPAYLYFFSRVPPIENSETLGAYHAAEIPYVFATLEGQHYTATDRAVSAAMSDAWVRFAQNGDPNGAGLPSWPRYDDRTEAYLEFGDEIRVGKGLRRDRVALWRAYYDDGGHPPRVERD